LFSRWLVAPHELFWTGPVRAVPSGEISYEDALRYADSQNEVRLRIMLSQGGNVRTLSQVLDGVYVRGGARRVDEPSS
jgi:hypothetical protein